MPLRSWEVLIVFCYHPSKTTLDLFILFIYWIFIPLFNPMGIQGSCPVHPCQLFGCKMEWPLHRTVSTAHTGKGVVQDSACRLALGDPGFSPKIITVFAQAHQWQPKLCSSSEKHTSNADTRKADWHLTEQGRPRHRAARLGRSILAKEKWQADLKTAHSPLSSWLIFISIHI